MTSLGESPDDEKSDSDSGKKKNAPGNES